MQLDDCAVWSAGCVPTASSALPENHRKALSVPRYIKLIIVVSTAAVKIVHFRLHAPLFSQSHSTFFLQGVMKFIYYLFRCRNDNNIISQILKIFTYHQDIKG